MPKRNKEPETKTVTLTEEEIANVIELWTGVPATSITENEFAQIDRLESSLKEHIVGQDTAVAAVSKAIKRHRAGIAYKRKPVSFIFAGNALISLLKDCKSYTFFRKHNKK